jgi:hypothetical protein
VTLSSNGPGWYHRVPVAAVALGSNGPPMSMRPLLLWVTDKWTGYETNQEVTAMTLSSNRPGWYHLVPIAALGLWQEDRIWNYLTWRARWERHAINRGCSKDTSSNMQAGPVTEGSKKWRYLWKDEKLISSIFGRDHNLLVVSKYLCESVPLCACEVGLIGKSLLWPFTCNSPRWYHSNSRRCYDPE